MVEEKAERKYIIGAKQVIKKIKAGEASNLYVASDCDKPVCDEAVFLAEKAGIPVFYVSTRKELGQMCGINVKASCAVQTI